MESRLEGVDTEGIESLSIYSTSHKHSCFVDMRDKGMPKWEAQTTQHRILKKTK